MSNRTRTLGAAFVCAFLAVASAETRQSSTAANGAPLPVDVIELTREMSKQGALGLLLLAVLWSYRRDFFRKDEERNRQVEQGRQDRERLEEIIVKSTETVQGAAVAMARQTDATHRLARTVENLERKAVKP